MHLAIEYCNNYDTFQFTLSISTILLANQSNNWTWKFYLPISYWIDIFAKHDETWDILQFIKHCNWNRFSIHFFLFWLWILKLSCPNCQVVLEPSLHRDWKELNVFKGCKFDYFEIFQNFQTFFYIPNKSSWTLTKLVGCAFFESHKSQVTTYLSYNMAITKQKLLCQ